MLHPTHKTLLSTALAVSLRSTMSSEYSSTVGLACLILAFVCHGLHSTFAKLAGPHVSPVVYVFYLSIGFLIACTVVVLAMSESLVWSIPGFAAGVLLSISLTAYIQSIALIGMVWCEMVTASSAAVTAFLWVQFVLLEPSMNLNLAIAGLLMVIAGVVGVSSVLALRLSELKLDEMQLLQQPRRLATGILLAVLAGVAGGAGLRFNELQPLDQQGIAFVWAQALGLLAAQVVIMLFAYMVDLAPLKHTGHAGGFVLGEFTPHDGLEFDTSVAGRLEPTKLLPLALCQGIILAATHLTTTMAGLSPYGFGTAEPIREAGRSLAVLIGVVCFQEYGEACFSFLATLLLCVGVEVGGIALLTIYGGLAA